jgi:hypothetical protein
MSEHKDYMCVDCASTWVRYEHIDGKDCDNTCDNPCLIRMCNEEDCIGNAIMVGA